MVEKKLLCLRRVLSRRQLPFQGVNAMRLECFHSLGFTHGSREALYKRHTHRHIHLLWLWLFLFLFSSVRCQKEEESIVRRTLEADKASLLTIRDDLKLNITTWDIETDPCKNNWDYVSCNCEDFRAAFPELQDHCEDQPDVGDKSSRIVFLRMTNTFGNEEFNVSGQLPSAIGNLTALRYLNLEANALTGPIPDSFKNLKELRYLSLAQNQLTGPLPDYFGYFEHLRTLKLNTNAFNGSLPEEWCNDTVGGPLFRGLHQNATIFTIDGNPICGNLPDCLENHLYSLEGTYLCGEFEFEDSNCGLCDDTPPECPGFDECFVRVPKFWTNAENISFNYTQFDDKESFVTRVALDIRKTESDETDSIYSLEEGLQTVLGPKQGNGTLIMAFFNASLTEQGFLDGSQYKVFLTAQNSAGPPLNRTIESEPVTVDFSPPEFGDIYNLGPAGPQLQMDFRSDVTVAWKFIQDPHSDVVSLLVALEKLEEDNRQTEICFKVIESEKVEADKIKLIDGSYTFSTVTLEKGKTYRFSLTATNGAGLVETSTSSEFLVNDPESTQLLMWITATVISVIVFMVVVIFAIKACWRKRDLFDSDIFIKDYIYELLGIEEDQQMPQPMTTIENNQRCALVITDIENSTRSSERNAGSYNKLLKTHNDIMKRVSRKHAGKIVGEEGDSFTIAFQEITHAVCFAQSIQETLLNWRWPYDVLRLPTCRKERHSSGKLIFAGPRVRIGIHWIDAPGLIVSKGNENERSLNVGGQAEEFENGQSLSVGGQPVEFAKIVSDAGHGGQILLSHEAWEKVRVAFPGCKFPSVHQLGLYRSATCNVKQDFFIYSIIRRLGNDLLRSFPPVRKLDKIEEGSGWNVIPCPKRGRGECLTFVAIKMRPFDEDLPTRLSDMLYEVLRTKAQIFSGYLLTTNREKARYLFVFASPIDALLFTQASQLTLVLTHWPTEISKFIPDYVPSESKLRPQSHIPLFNGPRLAMAVHTTNDFQDVDTLEPFGSRPCHWSGPGIEFVQHVVNACDGGQVVLTEPVWTATQHMVLNHCHCISLGKHLVAQRHQPMQLMQVMPRLLARRRFRELCTHERRSDGYAQAPSADAAVAIVFVSANTPKCVTEAERERREQQSNLIHIVDGIRSEVVEVFDASLEIFASILRRSLVSFNGYECKQLSPGGFLLAFTNLIDAVLWAGFLQSELLSANWPKELLDMEECKIEICDRSHQPIKGGLSIRAGIGYGSGMYKEPGKDGQADYFGYIPNVAARLHSIARPGQILIYSFDRFHSCRPKWLTSDVCILHYPDRIDVPMHGAVVEITWAGRYLARGTKEEVDVYKARLPWTKDEETMNSEVKQEHKKTPRCRRSFGNFRLKFLAVCREAILHLDNLFGDWRALRNRESTKFTNLYYPSDLGQANPLPILPVASSSAACVEMTVPEDSGFRRSTNFSSLPSSSGWAGSSAEGRV